MYRKICYFAWEYNILRIVKLAIKKGPVVKMFTTLFAQHEMCSDEWVTGILTTVRYVFLTTVGYVFLTTVGYVIFVPTQMHVVTQFPHARLTK